MALFDFDDEQRSLLIGIGVGVATAILVKGVGPAFRGVGRPLAKASIRSGILMADKTREMLAHMREDYEDLVAEVRAEMQEQISEQKQAPGGVPEPEPQGGTQ
jgi:hypothetical protein